MKLSIVMPVYNEQDTIAQVIDKVCSVDVGMEKELILVEDCSTDNTRAILQQLSRSHPEWHLILHQTNQGKGAALRSGFTAATGDIVLIQDADLEYDPGEYPVLIKPILAGKADVVFGSRFVGGQAHRVVYFWHRMGNNFLTLLSNMCTDINLSDMETCYKVFHRDVLQKIRVTENRFGFEPEITAKLAAIKDIRIYEVGISYYGRTYEQGKKIGWKDGIRAIIVILKYGFLRVSMGRNSLLQQ